MGCTTSKLDRLPAVALCRERCKFLEKALRQSYALTDAHVAHMESLKTLGSALLCFLNQFEDTPINEIKPQPPKSPPSSSFSSSDSDALVLLHSESEAEDGTDKQIQYFTQSTVASVSDNAAFMNPLYATFSQHLPNHGGYYGSKPPSPPPPTNSAWDFLNLFEPYEKYEVPYNPHNDAREEEKGNVVSEEPQKGKEGDSGKKNIVSEKEAPELEECSGSNSKKGLCEAVKEIQILFERASDSGDPILEMLDVGKLRYHRKFAFTRGNRVFATLY